jgi:hypothetical protein
VFCPKREQAMVQYELFADFVRILYIYSFKTPPIALLTDHWKKLARWDMLLWLPLMPLLEKKGSGANFPIAAAYRRLLSFLIFTSFELT